MRTSRRAEKALATKLAEIREALISAGCDTIDKQATALGIGRSTAYALLNLDKRAGPSAIVVKRVLSSPNLPPRVRQKFKEYVANKIHGRYGHSKPRARAFRDVLTEH
jgi:hypothetical protein